MSQMSQICSLYNALFRRSANIYVSNLRFAVVWLGQIHNFDTGHVYLLGLKSGSERLLRRKYGGSRINFRTTFQNLGVFLRFWVEAVNFFRREKLCRQDYLDYLKNRAESGDMAVQSGKVRVEMWFWESPLRVGPNRISSQLPVSDWNFL